MALWDMSRHCDLMEQGYQETVKFLADQDFSGEGDREASPDAAMPGLSVQAEQTKEDTSETRGAAEARKPS